MNQMHPLRLPDKTPVPNAGTTPVPNMVLDRVMPTLRDTELRLLLVVVRQTRGWQDAPGSSQRKERDWLTQSQLMARTGRGSGAVAHAVEALVQAGLIEVQDRAGCALVTAGERRRHLGRLYYRLGAGAAQAASEPVPLEVVTNASAGVWKTGFCLWKTGGRLWTSGDELGKKVKKTAHAKAHTTKETGNKINKSQASTELCENVDNSEDSPLTIKTKGWEKAGSYKSKTLV